MRNRASIVEDINSLLDDECGVCREQERIKFEDRTHFQRYCINECAVGQQLQGLGQELIEICRRERKNE